MSEDAMYLHSERKIRKNSFRMGTYQLLAEVDKIMKNDPDWKPFNDDTHRGEATYNLKHRDPKNTKKRSR